MSLSNVVRKAMQLAKQEAERVGAKEIDTEHVLLGLLKVGRGLAAQILQRNQITLREIRNATLVEGIEVPVGCIVTMAEGFTLTWDTSDAPKLSISEDDEPQPEIVQRPTE